jgi:hypothetical protein
MGRRLGIATRAELLEVVRERYGSGRSAERRLVRDEFVAVSGYHRKYAIRLLRPSASGPAADRRGRSPLHDTAAVGSGHAPGEAEGASLLALACRPVRGGRGRPSLLVM